MSRRVSGVSLLIAIAFLIARQAWAVTLPREAITRGPGVRLSTSTGGAGRPGRTVVTETRGADRSPQLVPGRVVVKFRSDGPHAVSACAQTTFEKRRALADATADRSDSLDRLGGEVGLRRVRALLPDRVGLDTAAARRRADDLKERLGRARPGRAGLVRDERPLPELFNVFLLEFDRSLDPREVSRLFAGDGHVEYAHPDYVATVRATPNDPYFASSGSWGQGYDDLWGLKRISCPSAWDSSRGDGVVVAVVDTGLDMDHPDIASNVWTNPGEIPDNGVDDDGNGYVDDVNGWNFVYVSPGPTDGHGHGTHVSGTIAAVGDNGVGVIGVAPRARIMPVKALDDDGSAPFSTLAVALTYAAVNAADVINNSWGCNAPCPSVPVVEDAVRLAHGLGAVVVFAAGNSGEDVVDYSPANLPEPVVVSATDESDALTYFSNVGDVDVAAPGGGTTTGPPASAPERNVLSLKAASCSVDMCPPELVVGGQYLRQAGTSMAAPHVSGLAALVLARMPSLSNEQVRQVLRTSAVDLGTPGFDSSFGYGRIDAGAALSGSAPLEVVILGPSRLRVPVADVVAVDGRAHGPGFDSWRLAYGAGSLPSTWTVIASSSSPVTGGRLATWSITAIPDGEYTLRLTAQNSAGTVFEDRRKVLIDRVEFASPSPSRITLFRAGDTVTLIGTAALGGFQSYSLKLRRATGEEVEGSGLTAANGGIQPVVDGVLGTWVVPDGQEHYSIEMIVLSSLQTVTESVKVAADPTLHPGWPKALGLIGTDSFFLGLMEHLVAADVDGDGGDDLLVGYGSDVRIFDHAGAHLSGWPQTIDPEGHGIDTVTSSPAVGDVNGDGLPEVVAATNYGRVFVWDRAGTLLPGWPRYLGQGLARATLADVDGNGLDEIVLTSDEEVGVFDSQGTALPGWPVVFPGAFLMQPPAVGDLNRDGKAEVVVAAMEAPSNLFVLSSTGLPLSGWPVATYPTQTPGDQNNPMPALGDLDGDGDLEVVFAPGSGEMLAFHHTGAPVAGWPQAVKPQQFNYPVVADLDGDGRDEVVAGAYVEESVTTVYAWRGDGTALAGWPVALDLGGYPADFGDGQVAVADVDGDGGVEVLVGTDVTYPAFSMRAIRLDGTAVPMFPKPTPRASMFATVSAIADLDGDGLLEMAWIDRSAELHVWDLTSVASSSRPWPMFGRSARRTAATEYTARPVITASANGPSTVQLSWTPLFGAAGYRIDVASDQGFTILLAGHANEAVGNVTSYAVGGLDPATTYYARVRAEWPSRTSANSGIAAVTTPAGPLGLYILSPCRVLDTRSAGGPTGGETLAAGSRNVFTVTGKCGVPPEATALVANLTAVNGTASGALQVLPGHLLSSETSSLNISAGRTRANNALVSLSAAGDGTIAVVNASAGTVHFILDASGYLR